MTLKFTELKYDQNKWNQEKESKIDINTDINFTSTGNVNLNTQGNINLTESSM
jgi:hypothetical protein